MRGPAARTDLDPAMLVRPEVRSRRAYHLDLSPCRHKLDQNEVPWELPPPVRRRALDRLARRSWTSYPDFHSDALRGALGERHGWPADGVLVGNGSNELLGVILEACAPPGGEVVTALPSFGLYPMLIERCGARPRFVGPAPRPGLPYAELREEVERDPRRPVIVCTPNNPTGDALTPDHVEELLVRLEAPLLLDNAYGELCEHDYRPLLAGHRHLVILRTFSKAWSLAGLRLGYLLCDPRLAAELIKVKLPYNVGHAAAVAGEEALAASAAVDRRVRVIAGRRRQWAEMLAAAGCEVFPSEANFLLVRTPAAARIRDGLAARGIRVRDVSGYPGLADCLRVSVGDGPALRAVQQALQEIDLEGERA